MHTGKKINTDQEPFVSVLTPVYNGEDFLKECIESVLRQNYENWEYVIVNNCSTDRSLEIAKEYAAIDRRIRVHNNEEFFSQMKNLNHAFRQISPVSKYCKVVHADDLLFPECISRMVALAEKYPSIGIVSSYQLIDKEVGPNGIEYPKNIFSGKEFGKRYLSEEMRLIAHPSANLIRSELIRKREKFYDEAYMGSDTAAFLDTLCESNFGFVYQVLTFTRLHENSVTSTENKKHIYLLNLLRINLEYAPIFLTDLEARRIINKRERIYYIQFARNIWQENTIQAYKLHSRLLQSIDQPVKKAKLMKYLIREPFVQLAKKMGIE